MTSIEQPVEPDPLIFSVELTPRGVMVGKHNFPDIAQAGLIVAGYISEMLDKDDRVAFCVESFTLNGEDKDAFVGLVQKYLSGEPH